MSEVAGREKVMGEKKGIWLALAARSTFLVHRVATLAAVTAGPTWQTTFKWTGSSILRLTATLRSRENWAWTFNASSPWVWLSVTHSTAPSQRCFRRSAFLSKSITNAIQSNGSALVSELFRWKRFPRIKGTYITAALVFFALTKTSRIRGHLSRHSRFPGEKQKVIRSTAGTTWSGRATWSIALRLCSLPVTVSRHCGRSFTWQSRNWRTGAFPRTFGLMEGPTGGESNSTKLPFLFFLPTRSSGLTLSRILTHTQ